jgi:hypothetical protein
MQPVPQSVDPTSQVPELPPARAINPVKLGVCAAVGSEDIRAERRPLTSVRAMSVWGFIVTSAGLFAERWTQNDLAGIGIPWRLKTLGNHKMATASHL